MKRFAIDVDCMRDGKWREIDATYLDTRRFAVAYFAGIIHDAEANRRNWRVVARTFDESHHCE
jgi:hypothetical protein